MSSLTDESIISDFVTESREHLASIEPDLLLMEQDGARVDAEVVNRVFRAIHSIKGGAGFFAFECLKGLSHAMESVLMQVRDGKLQVAPAIMDVLLAALDRLRAMLDDIHRSDAVPCDADMTALQAILEGQGVAHGRTVQARQGTRSFDLDAEDVRSALRRGMSLYHATAYLHRDIKDKGLTPLAFLKNALSVGACLDAYVDVQAIADLGSCLEADLPVTLLFGTVLEPDLAALGLRLPSEQVVLLDMAALKAEMREPESAPPPVAEAPPPPAPAGDAEERPGHAREAGGETLRVRVDLLTHLMNLAGELVLGRNQLLRTMEPHRHAIPGLAPVLQDISQVTTEVQEGIMQTRMQPIGTVFSRFPRIIRDLSRSLGKQIEVQIQGAEVELDKSIVEMLVDPLTHLIRNCADHAIELPSERSAARKPPTGTVFLHAFHEGGQVNIAISDDGRGIDAKKVLEKAIAKGILTRAQASDMTDREIVGLIFAPGFSTAEQVSEISGRGVGMDVVRTNVERLGGHVEVETEVGVGTTVRLRLPLTLAIIPSMIVGVGCQRFAIPQVNVVEFVWVRAAEAASRIEHVQGALVLRLRDKLLPLVRLADALALPRTFRDADGFLQDDRRSLADPRSEARGTPDRRSDWRSDHNIVVLRVGNNAFGVIVDELYDIEEIVVKPLSCYLQGLKCFSGATILGDGRVIMILDAGGIATLSQLHFLDLHAEEKRRAEEEHRAEALKASRRRSVILFEAAPGERFAVPQDRVLRLERLDPGSIERIGDREYLEYRGTGLPLLRLDRHLEVHPLPAEAPGLFLVIPKVPGGPPPAGILITAILDALDVEVELKPLAFEGPGLLGSAMVGGHLTLFLDPVALVQEAGLAEGAKP